jgi:hypothetical protein
MSAGQTGAQPTAVIQGGQAWHRSGTNEAAEKRVIAVRFMEKHASGAKAHFDLIGFIGTTESRALSKRRLRLSL